MRLIGHLESEPQARAIGEFLFAQGIGSEVERERDGHWALWVHDEDRIDEATRFLAEYRAQPADPRYAAASRVAKDRRAREEAEDEAARKRFHDRSQVFPQGWQAAGKLTLALIVISVIVGVLSKGAFTGDDLNRPVVNALSITPQDFRGGYVYWMPGLPEIRHGQIWRLLTPAFLHFGFLHLLFNMMWLFDLGSMIERRRGATYLAILVVVIAVTSNLAQYALRGPSFGGMSGVVYGLIGYIWMKGRFDPNSGLFLHPTTVTMAVIWYFLCLAGVMPNAANVVHTVGFGVGLVWGWTSAQIATRGK